MSNAVPLKKPSQTSGYIHLLLLYLPSPPKTLTQRQEIPGGKVDDTDETVLHALVRELKEETGLEATKIVRKVGEFGWEERRGKWLKLVFEVEVKEMNIVLDAEEHQEYLFATEEEIVNDKVKDVALSYISPPNKVIKLEAFKLRRDGAVVS